jgi:hypothetical protein
VGVEPVGTGVLRRELVSSLSACRDTRLRHIGLRRVSASRTSGPFGVTKPARAFLGSGAQELRAPANCAWAFPAIQGDAAGRHVVAR